MNTDNVWTEAVNKRASIIIDCDLDEIRVIADGVETNRKYQFPDGIYVDDVFTVKQKVRTRYPEHENVRKLSDRFTMVYRPEADQVEIRNGNESLHCSFTYDDLLWMINVMHESLEAQIQILNYKKQIS